MYVCISNRENICILYYSTYIFSVELKFTGREGSGLHVVPLESIQERVHIISRVPGEKRRFFVNRYQP